MNIADLLRNAKNALPDKEDIASVLEHVREGQERSAEMLRGILGPEVVIDEMSLLVNSKNSVLNLLTHLVSFPGYEMFNSASDSVTTGPIRSQYDVNYWFVRTPHPYRLEVMEIPVREGFSPLHSKLPWHSIVNGTTDNDIFAVHASFKCDSSSYAAAGVLLRKAGWELAQRCDSAYGKFSYYVNEDLGGWYLKPRVNLRDAASDE